MIVSEPSWSELMKEKKKRNRDQYVKFSSEIKERKNVKLKDIIGAII